MPRASGPLVSVGPETAMLNLHLRKDAENVPVFRGGLVAKLSLAAKLSALSILASRGSRRTTSEEGH
jgi:hypothetical protein